MHPSSSVAISTDSLHRIPADVRLVFHALGEHHGGARLTEWASFDTRCSRAIWRYRWRDQEMKNGTEQETAMVCVRLDTALMFARPCLICWPESRRPIKLDGSPMTAAELW